MKLKAILPILFICLLTFNSCKVKQSPITMLNGTWIGEAYQFNTDEKWSISFFSNMKKRGYFIDYPSLGCGGKWILEEHHDNRFQFREVLDEGFDICTDRGKVELVLEDKDRIAFFYYWPDDRMLTASGYLYRKYNK